MKLVHIDEHSMFMLNYWLKSAIDTQGRPTTVDYKMSNIVLERTPMVALELGDVTFVTPGRMFDGDF